MKKYFLGIIVSIIGLFGFSFGDTIELDLSSTGHNFYYSGEINPVLLQLGYGGNNYPVNQNNSSNPLFTYKFFDYGNFIKEGTINIEEMCFNNWGTYVRTDLQCGGATLYYTGNNGLFCARFSGSGYSLGLNDIFNIPCFIHYGNDYYIGSVLRRTSSINGGYFDFGDFKLLINEGFAPASSTASQGFPNYIRFNYQSNAGNVFNLNVNGETIEITDDYDIYLENATYEENNNIIQPVGLFNGINLNYFIESNSITEFYSKDKLYLSGYYNYLNNVFNPICF